MEHYVMLCKDERESLNEKRENIVSHPIPPCEVHERQARLPDRGACPADRKRPSSATLESGTVNSSMKSYIQGFYSCGIDRILRIHGIS
jgi:hypothetical protein